MSREKRLAGVTFVLVMVFMSCYLPFWSVYICLVSVVRTGHPSPGRVTLFSLLLQAFFPSCPAPSPGVLATIQWLTLTSAAINPIVYTVFNTDFRLAIRQTLLLLVCSCSSLKKRYFVKSDQDVVVR